MAKTRRRRLYINLAGGRLSGEFQNPRRRFAFKEGAAIIYPYRSILNPIQFDDPS